VPKFTSRPRLVSFLGVLSLGLVSGLALSMPVSALTIRGECFLEVEGETHIDGPCDIDMEKGGSFMMSELRRHPMFVMVNIHEDEGTVTANWNGPERERHAHGQLGTVTRSGGCWKNADTRICAWKKGTRPRDFR